MASDNSFRHLQVWQRAIELVIALYEVTQSLPVVERYGLQSQARRAAVSIPANIAEGHGRWHPREFLQSLNVARASLQELETHIELMVRLGYIRREDTNEVTKEAKELSAMLIGLMKAVRRRL